MLKYRGNVAFFVLSMYFEMVEHIFKPYRRTTFVIKYSSPLISGYTLIISGTYLTRNVSYKQFPTHTPMIQRRGSNRQTGLIARWFPLMIPKTCYISSHKCFSGFLCTFCIIPSLYIPMRSKYVENRVMLYSPHILPHFPLYFNMGNTENAF